MKTITFSYMKKDGSVSDRTLLALVTPGDKYAGIDMSEISPEEAMSFAEEYEELQGEFMEKTRELQEKYDLKHAYRQFFESGMKDITEI
jgi:hypothetical protein